MLVGGTFDSGIYRHCCVKIALLNFTECKNRVVNLVTLGVQVSSCHDKEGIFILRYDPV